MKRNYRIRWRQQRHVGECRCRPQWRHASASAPTVAEAHESDSLSAAKPLSVNDFKTERCPRLSRLRRAWKALRWSDAGTCRSTFSAAASTTSLGKNLARCFRKGACLSRVDTVWTQLPTSKLPVGFLPLWVDSGPIMMSRPGSPEAPMVYRSEFRRTVQQIVQ